MSETLRRRDIAARVSSKLGTSRAVADAALGAVLQSIQEALADGDRVVLTGFGRVRAWSGAPGGRVAEAWA